MSYNHHNTMMIQHNARRIVELNANQPAASLVMVRRRTAGNAGNPAAGWQKLRERGSSAPRKVRVFYERKDLQHTLFCRET